MDPAITIALVAIGIAAGSTAIQKLLTDQDRVDKIKEKMNQLKKQSKEEKGTESQKEMMSLSKEMMKHNFKPMLITIIPTLLVILWVKAKFSGTGIVTTLPILNINLTWLWWYILVAMVTSLTLEGIYKLYRKSKKKD